MTARLGANGSRWIKSVLLALCLDAAGMGLAGILMGSPRQAGIQGVPASLRVSLSPALSDSRAAAPIAKAPAATVPVPAPPKAPLPIPVSEAGPAVDTVQPLPEWSGSRLPDLGTGPGAAERQSEVPGGATTEIELLQRIDALVSRNLVYPPLARKRNIEGAVRLSLLIGKDGSLIKSSITSSSGSSILDKAAMALVEGIFPLGLMYDLDGEAAIGIRVVYSLTS